MKRRNFFKALGGVAGFVTGGMSIAASDVARLVKTTLPKPLNSSPVPKSLGWQNYYIEMDIGNSDDKEIKRRLDEDFFK